jgi:hypothetical protein
MAFIKILGASVALAGTLLVSPAALGSPAPATASTTSAFPKSFSGTIDGCFPFAGFQYCVNETFRSTFETANPTCIKKSDGVWSCTYALTNASGTIAGVHLDDLGNGTPCSVNAHGLHFGQYGLGQNAATITLDGDREGSVYYIAEISSHCNAGWSASSDGTPFPTPGLPWKLGTAARWNVYELEFPPPIQVDSPLDITWHGKFLLG